MKTETKHTPGPWHIAPRKPGNAYRITQSETPQTGALVIADLSCGAHRPDAEQAANARLIAASPDLFHAVEVALEIFRAMADPEHCMHETTSKNGLWAEWRDYMKATIDKTK